MSNLKDRLDQRIEDPVFTAKYDAMRPEHDSIRSIIGEENHIID